MRRITLALIIIGLLCISAPVLAQGGQYRPDIGCAKLEMADGYGASWVALADLSEVTIKAGTESFTWTNVKTGDILTVPNGKDISHVIMCDEEEQPSTTTTSTPPVDTTITTVTTAPSPTTTIPAPTTTSTTPSSSTTVTTPTTSTSPSSSSSTMPETTLPRTGLSTPNLLGLGLALLCAGTMLVLTIKTRTSHDGIL